MKVPKSDDRQVTSGDEKFNYSWEVADADGKKESRLCWC
jgi:hypothetical protein